MSFYTNHVKSVAGQVSNFIAIWYDEKKQLKINMKVITSKNQYLVTIGLFVSKFHFIQEHSCPAYDTKLHPLVRL